LRIKSNLSKAASAVLMLPILSATGLCAAEVLEIKRDVTYKTGEGFVDIMRADQQIARYIHKDTPKPYMYPIRTLSGTQITSLPDMCPKPHERSFWVGLGDVNGSDFWNEGENRGKIVQKKLSFEGAGGQYWNLHATNSWEAPDGRVLILEDRRYSFTTCQYGLMVSTKIKLTALGPVTLGDTGDGLLGFRLRSGSGYPRILNSFGETGKKCSGRRARWCDYSVELDGKQAGITVFDLSENPGYPTYWVVRPDGFFSVSPLGGKAFTGDAKNSSAQSLKRGESVTFVYIVLVHDGIPGADTLDWIALQAAGSPTPSLQAEEAERRAVVMP